MELAHSCIVPAPKPSATIKAARAVLSLDKFTLLTNFFLLERFINQRFRKYFTAHVTGFQSYRLRPILKPPTCRPSWIQGATASGGLHPGHSVRPWRQPWGKHYDEPSGGPHPPNQLCLTHNPQSEEPPLAGGSSDREVRYALRDRGSVPGHPLLLQDGNPHV